MTINSPDATKLQNELANRILAFAKSESLEAGAKLKEEFLSETFEVSRSPVRKALGLLMKEGFVGRISHRGFFLRVNASDLPPVSMTRSAGEAARLYEAMISDYMDGALQNRVSEAQLQRRYRTDRTVLLEALTRLSIEGIITSNLGYGWTFEPMVRTPTANIESQRFRLILEPAGLREPTFHKDEGKLLEVRREQADILERLGPKTEPSAIFQASVRFHELLARLSGNRFILRAIEHQSRQRTLVDYRSYDDLDRVVTFYSEHIEMIDHILDGRQESAARLMEHHIRFLLTLTPAGA